jgi:diguanylate cyclase (GGDEF)-like protein
MADRTIVYFGPGKDAPSKLIHNFAADHALQLVVVDSGQAVHDLMNRGFPSCLVLDAEGESKAVVQLCRELKSDSFTAIVPVAMLTPPDRADLAAACLTAGADDVVARSVSEEERRLRLNLVMHRAERDVAVHPTTRLPGTIQIERDIGARITSGRDFAVCYADLDSFKEFNDRYGYNHGDFVILLLSRILRDVVRGLAPGGFVGHIGGDDFIFNVWTDHLEQVCDEIIELFDELAPYQYTEEDRRAGYFLGKDRRGSIHRVALMTLSIGVVTSRGRKFTHTARVSELAGEMKSYAKTLPGSVYSVDRRNRNETMSPDEAVAEAHDSA